MSTHVTCGHCGGTGACTRSEKGGACASCRDPGDSPASVRKCSICNGTGWVVVEDN